MLHHEGKENVACSVAKGLKRELTGGHLMVEIAAAGGDS